MTAAVNAAPETATLQMIRAEVNTRELQRWMGTRRLQDTDHAMHCLLVECFGDLAPSPSASSLRALGQPPSCTATAWLEADALREASAIYADPAAGAHPACQHTRQQANAHRVATGKRLGFDIRIRPVVRLLRNSLRSYRTPNRSTQLPRMAATGAARSVTPFCGRRCCILRGEDGT